MRITPFRIRDRGGEAQSDRHSAGPVRKEHNQLVHRRRCGFLAAAAASMFLATVLLAATIWVDAAYDDLLAVPAELLLIIAGTMIILAEMQNPATVRFPLDYELEEDRS